LIGVGDLTLSRVDVKKELFFLDLYIEKKNRRRKRNHRHL